MDGMTFRTWQNGSPAHRTPVLPADGEQPSRISSPRHQFSYEPELPGLRSSRRAGEGRRLSSTEPTMALLFALRNAILYAHAAVTPWEREGFMSAGRAILTFCCLAFPTLAMAADPTPVTSVTPGGNVVPQMHRAWFEPAVE